MTVIQPARCFKSMSKTGLTHFMLTLCPRLLFPGVNASLGHRVSLLRKSCKNKSYFFCLLFSFLFLSGCSNEPRKLSPFLPSTESQKINNLLDINNDKKSDLVFWNTSSMSKNGKFLEPCFFETINVEKGTYKKLNYGEVADIPFAGFFDEDGIIEYGVYRYSETSGEFIIKNGGNGSEVRVTLGFPGDLPVPSDFNGDGKYDTVVYRPGDKTFYGILSANNVGFQVELGNLGDIPVPKDYDGDNRADFATYNQKSGLWTIRTSRDGQTIEQKLGGKDFLPIPADYDGDGKADLCVWNFNDGKINVLLTTLRRPIADKIVESIQKEIKGKDFFPMSLDYDGDGISELAFWNSSSKILLTFNIDKDVLSKKTYHFSAVTNSLPVQNFLLKRYLLKDELNKKSVLAMNSKEEFVADFDGDYVLDSCLWSKDTGTFLCNSSRVGWKFALEVGQVTDIPVAGYFNSDNIADIGVYRPLARSFYVRYLGKFAPKDIVTITFDQNLPKNCIPKINDYDGDGVDDLALYNPGDKAFIIRKSSDFQEIKLAYNQIDKINSGK